MNSTTTAFGLHDTARKIARRHQRTLHVTESTPPPARSREAETLADLLVYARKFKRPLAA